MRLVAVLFWLPPVAALFLVGFWFLWQTGGYVWWVSSLLFFATLGFGLQAWARRRDREFLAGLRSEADSSWPPDAGPAWKEIEELARNIKSGEYAVDGINDLLGLGRIALEKVARAFHPNREEPLMELTLPHGLLIVERACHDLRTEIVENIPFSHCVTIGDVARLQRWGQVVQRGLGWYRWLRPLVNPVGFLRAETLNALTTKTVMPVGKDFRCWLLQEYVRKIGKYAIELYSGRLTLGAIQLAPSALPSCKDVHEEKRQRVGREEEPLRILVLGRSNQGKSSLVNALFGEVMVATDILPDECAQTNSFRLERDGLIPALIFDMPGINTRSLSQKVLLEQTNKADLILWVTAAHRPDRELEGEIMSRLRSEWQARPDHHPPTLLVAVSHIDQLRPIREWQPPYDLTDAQNAKARNIRDAVARAALDLDTPVSDVIPVCLAEGRNYNVSDCLWAAILEHQTAANRVRLLRLRYAQKKVEDTELLWRQLKNSGRFLVDLPSRLLK